MLITYDKQNNSNIFSIKKHDKLCVLRQICMWCPKVHDSYLVYNIGRTNVFAKLKYGSFISWDGDITNALIRPGELKELEPGESSYYITAIDIYNQSDIRAMVHCRCRNQGCHYLYNMKSVMSESLDEDPNDLLNLVFNVGIKYIPYVKNGLSGLLNAFWPKNDPNLWEQIHHNIEALVDDKELLSNIGVIFRADLSCYKDRMSVLLQEIKDGVGIDDIRNRYMNIAQDLIGFEDRFAFDNGLPHHQVVNKFILPFYSTSVLMKVSFYVIGIQQQNEIGLTSENIKTIKFFADLAIHGENGANKYITELYKDNVDHVYNTGLADELYDKIMNVRTCIAIHGLEYIPIWNHMLENPMDMADPYNDVISYSTLYGRQTPNILKEAIPDEVFAPLTPNLINGRRNKITYLDFYLWRLNETSTAKIGGMKIHFENNEIYTMGTLSNIIQKVYFNGALLIKLQVYGDGAIDYLIFNFSDGRVQTCGTREPHDHHTVFELKDHHIVSFYLASDSDSLKGQAANLSVAYQLLPI